MISRAYLEHVEDGFRRRGPEEHSAFVASTEAAPVPVWDLTRVDHPS